MAAWRKLHGDDVRFHLVADDSLWRVLDEDALREFRLLYKNKQLTTRPTADSLILELARDHNLHVITRDHYIDHRGEHPWIDSSPERFHGWTTVDGEVRIEPLGIVARSAQTISVAIEVKDLKRAVRLDSKNPRHRKVLGRRWQCSNTSCADTAEGEDQLLAWPSVTPAGEARCPSCGQQLTDLGPRDPLYEVVVGDRASGDEIMRFPLEVNGPVVVGRGPGLKGIDLEAHHAHFPAVLQVSRRHLMLRIEHVKTSRRLVAVDLGSSNGTEVERWDRGAFLQPKPLVPRQEIFLGSKDRLVLGDAVHLRLSGRHYVTASGKSEPAALDVPDWPGIDPEPGRTITTNAIEPGWS